MILTLPQAVIIATNTKILVADPTQLYFTISKALYYMNYSGDFLLYTLGGSVIRNELVLMFYEVCIMTSIMFSLCNQINFNVVFKIYDAKFISMSIRLLKWYVLI